MISRAVFQADVVGVIAALLSISWSVRNRDSWMGPLMSCLAILVIVLANLMA